MMHRQVSRHPMMAALIALLLLASAALTVSADSDEVAGAVVAGGGAAEVQAAPGAAAAPALAPANATQRQCSPSPSCPTITRSSGGWDIDMGGPGIYFERDTEDGD